MQYAAAFVAIYGAKLGKAHGKIAVAVQLRFVNQDVARAVHRLQAILCVVQLHRRIHVGRVETFVAGDLPHLAAHDVRIVWSRDASPFQMERVPRVASLQTLPNGFGGIACLGNDLGDASPCVSIALGLQDQNERGFTEQAV